MTSEESTAESLCLADLKGAVLTWTDSEGNVRTVEFDE